MLQEQNRAKAEARIPQPLEIQVNRPVPRLVGADLFGHYQAVELRFFVASYCGRDAFGCRFGRVAGADAHLRNAFA